MPKIERTVAIVGRPNVGKSALFNRLAKRRIAIVHDQPGVTRDRLSTECRLGSEPFTILDTGGIGAVVDGDFSVHVRKEAEIAMEASDLILFIVDGRAGITPVDLDLAQFLRRSKRDIILVVNKVDESMHESLADEFDRLGFKKVVAVSAAHGRNIGELVESIEELLPKNVPGSDEAEAVQAPLKLAIVGRPNVGKSSLLNAILGDGRSIVSPVAGTTRDAVDVPFRQGDADYLLIDTAGIRPRSRHRTSVEVFSVMRSEKSISRADLCVLVLDGPAGVTAQDKKIAGLIQEACKPCVIALNKWDLVKELKEGRGLLERTENEIRQDLFFLDYAPNVVLSALTGEHVPLLFRAVEQVRRAASEHLPTGPLNRLIQLAAERHPPPMVANRRLKILYATHTRANGPAPAAEVLLFVNDGKLLADGYVKYLETRIREKWPLAGVPLLIKARGRPPKKREE